MTTDTATTRTVARRYFDAWTSGEGPDALRPLLHDSFVFDAGQHRVEGREAFLAGGGWPERATTTMVAEGYDGQDAFQLYRAVHGASAVKIAEHLTVVDGRIAASEIIVDGAAFMAFMTGAAS
ncbi:MAG: nuclear transport factor 2 family protein [Acidimicrobiales bacterium]